MDRSGGVRQAARGKSGTPAAGETVGAVRRRLGIDSVAVRRRVLWLVAREMVTELRRQAAVEEWSAIGLALASDRWRPVHLASRMRQAADHLDPPDTNEAA